MNEQVKAWIDLGVKVAIIAIASYLVMVLVFKADHKHMDTMMGQLQTQVGAMDKQTQFLTTLYMNNNTDALFHMALEDEARGDFPSAVKKLSMAVQLSQRNAEQYNVKLQQILSRMNK